MVWQMVEDHVNDIFACLNRQESAVVHSLRMEGFHGGKAKEV